MSPSRKPTGARGLRRSHVPHRHGPAAPPTNLSAEAPAEPPPTEVARVPVTLDGHHLGDLHVPSGTDQALLARALEQLVMPPAWGKLGADLAALGPHRLAIGARAATAAAGGGRGVSAEEADRIAQWFGGIVDAAIRRGVCPPPPRSGSSSWATARPTR